MAHALVLTASSLGRSSQPTADGVLLLVDGDSVVTIDAWPQPARWVPGLVRLYRGDQEVLSRAPGDDLRWMVVGDDRFGTYRAVATDADHAVASAFLVIRPAPAVVVLPAKGTVSSSVTGSGSVTGLSSPTPGSAVADAPTEGSDDTTAPAAAADSTLAVTAGIEDVVASATREQPPVPPVAPLEPPADDAAVTRSGEPPAVSDSAWDDLVRAASAEVPNTSGFDGPADSHVDPPAPPVASRPLTTSTGPGTPPRTPPWAQGPVKPDPAAGNPPRISPPGDVSATPELRLPAHARPEDLQALVELPQGEYDGRFAAWIGLIFSVLSLIMLGLLSSRLIADADWFTAASATSDAADATAITGSPALARTGNVAERIGLATSTLVIGLGLVLLLAGAALGALEVRARQRRLAAGPLASRLPGPAVRTLPAILERASQIKATIAVLVAGGLFVLLGFVGQVYWAGLF